MYIWIKSSWGLDGRSRFEYSLDGDYYIRMQTYQLSWGFYRGDRIGVYSYNNIKEEGFVDVDYFNYYI